MNILTDDLPTSVVIGTTEYQIETDFRTCLRIILAFEDNELTPQEKQVILLSSVYPIIPTDTQAAIEKALLFLNGGEVAEEETNGLRLYSFGKDANLIFAAFRQTHGIDLEVTSLHWWKFLALFMDLGTDTTFCQLVGLRKRLKTGKATKEEKQAAREMASMIDLPEIDTRTLEEKEAVKRFWDLVEQGQKNHV